MHKAGGTGHETEPAATFSVSVRNNIFTDAYAIGNIGKKKEFSLKTRWSFLRQIIGFFSVQAWM